MSKGLIMKFEGKSPQSSMREIFGWCRKEISSINGVLGSCQKWEGNLQMFGREISSKFERETFGTFGRDISTVRF